MADLETANPGGPESSAAQDGAARDGAAGGHIVGGAIADGGTAERGQADATGYRPLMFSIAYGMTGSVADAEDIVQDVFAGLTKAERQGTVVESPRAYLATATTRKAISHLQSARVRRESYVGEWLPEPLLTDPAPGPDDRAELADSLSMAFLVLLEALSPAERAVFLLREVFGYGYDEIAGLMGRTEAGCRQLFSRARRHVDAARPVPGQAPSGSGQLAATPGQRAAASELAMRFFAAANGGDIDALLEMLAPDVVFIGDGGGKAPAVRSPVLGGQRVARFLAGIFRRGRVNHRRLAWVNGQPGLVGFDAAGQVATVMSLEVADGKVRAIRSIVNPDKLRHIARVSLAGGVASL